MKCIFSVDVEDWFHIQGLPSTPKISDWQSLPSRVESNFMNLLDIFSSKNVRVTCFFLGWIAERFPQLVKEAKSRGHEIASHGYSHKLVYEMDENEFLADLCKSKNIIENICHDKILGYRAPGFSVTNETPWFFDKLSKAGYIYDSSVFPAPRATGGLKTDKYSPYIMDIAPDHKIIEFPITAIKLFGKPLCFFGGGYLRLTPYFIIKTMSKKVIEDNRPVIFYIHPREIDMQQPRLKMGAQRRFNSYVNLNTTKKKILNMLNDFEIVTFNEFMKQHIINQDFIKNGK